MKSHPIRRARPDDAVALTKLAFAAKRHWRYPEGWIRAWSDQLTITPEFVRKNPVFVIDDEAGPCGVAAIELKETEAALVHLWVRPSAMGEGIGTALFTVCESAAREWGAGALTIESDPNAEGFYRKMGAILSGQVAADVHGSERRLPKLVKRLV